MRYAAVVADRLVPRTRPANPTGHKDVPTAVGGRVRVSGSEQPTPARPAGARVAIEADNIGLWLLYT